MHCLLLLQVLGVPNPLLQAAQQVKDACLLLGCGITRIMAAQFLAGQLVRTREVLQNIAGPALLQPAAAGTFSFAKAARVASQTHLLRVLALGVSG